MLQPTLDAACHHILIEQGASFRFLFEDTCKDAYTMVRRHFERPFQRTKYLMLRYLFYHNMWRCYVASFMRTFARANRKGPALPDVSGLGPRFGTMIKSILQECSRNWRLGIDKPLYGFFQSRYGFPCLMAQFRNGYCAGCRRRLAENRVMRIPRVVRMRRIDMRIFDTRPAAIRRTIE